MHALPPAAGIGFKPQHFAATCRNRCAAGLSRSMPKTIWARAGRRMRCWSACAKTIALSIHGVGLSIGGEDPLDRNHLQRLKALCARYQPESFSEHLAWSSHGGEFLADLLPLPYTGESLTRIAAHIDQVQETLGRRMLLENPATYLTFAESEISETEFLRELMRRTGCGLLLDINNVHVSAHNHGFSTEAYLAAFDMAAVEEIHLAGHFRHDTEDGTVLIDTHGARIAEAVWSLYDAIIARMGPLPTLIEWDNDVPEWPVLRDEAQRAQAILSAIPLARSA